MIADECIHLDSYYNVIIQIMLYERKLNFEVYRNFYFLYIFFYDHILFFVFLEIFIILVTNQMISCLVQNLSFNSIEIFSLLRKKCN